MTLFQRERIEEYLSCAPDTALRAVIETPVKLWCRGILNDRNGRRCLVGIAEDADTQTRYRRPFKYCFRPGVEFDQACEKDGFRKTVAECQEIAARILAERQAR